MGYVKRHIRLACYSSSLLRGFRRVLFPAPKAGRPAPDARCRFVVSPTDRRIRHHLSYARMPHGRTSVLYGTTPEVYISFCPQCPSVVVHPVSLTTAPTRDNKTRPAERRVLLRPTVQRGPARRGPRGEGRGGGGGYYWSMPILAARALAPFSAASSLPLLLHATAECVAPAARAPARDAWCRQRGYREGGKWIQ